MLSYEQYLEIRYVLFLAKQFNISIKEIEEIIGNLKSENKWVLQLKEDLKCL